jgi:MFS family permease
LTQPKERIFTMSAAATQPDLDSRKYRLRYWTLAVLSLSLLVIALDVTILNAAIPTLQRDLNASAASLQWIVNAYILVFAGLLLTMGTLGDRFGRRRALEIGLLIFGAASLGAAFADTSGQLIAARAAQGIGGALIMPSTLSVLVASFRARSAPRRSASGRPSQRWASHWAWWSAAGCWKSSRGARSSCSTSRSSARSSSPAAS